MGGSCVLNLKTAQNFLCLAGFVHETKQHATRMNGVGPTFNNTPYNYIIIIPFAIVFPLSSLYQTCFSMHKNWDFRDMTQS